MLNGYIAGYIGILIVIIGLKYLECVAFMFLHGILLGAPLLLLKRSSQHDFNQHQTSPTSLPFKNTAFI